MSDEATLTAAAPSVGADAVDTGSSTPTATPTEGAEPISSVPAGTETAQPEAAPTGAETDQIAATEEGGDGRLLPKAIRALKETDPSAYKAEKARFFEHREYKGTFPTVGDARRAKQTLDLVGGEAGLTKLQSDVGEFRNVAQQFANGDPAFIDDLAKHDPVAFGTHVPHMLEKYAETDRPGYNRIIARELVREFRAKGVQLRSQLETIYASFNAGDKTKGNEILNQVATWYDAVEDISKQEEDPRYKKLQQELKSERESNGKEAYKSFFSDYQKDAQSQINSATDKLLDSYLKDQRLDNEDKALLRRNAIQLANEIVVKDETFTKQRDLLLQRQDKTVSVRYAVSRYEQALGDSVKRVIRAFGRTGPAVVKAAPAAVPVAPKTPADGFARAAARPNPLEIDRTKTTNTMILNERKAVLKDGRKVTWAHIA